MRLYRVVLVSGVCLGGLVFGELLFLVLVAGLHTGGTGALGQNQVLVESLTHLHAVLDSNLQAEKQSPASKNFKYAALLPAAEFPVSGSKGKRTIRFSVEVEKSLEVMPLNFAIRVNSILSSPRSWSGKMQLKFAYTTPDLAKLRILLASPKTVDRRCRPLRTNSIFSCRTGSDVMINVRRWNEGARSWNSSLNQYRAYLINHEVGHFLGQGHARCRKRGALAPVMMQQTKSSGGCKSNGWPYPENRGMVLAGRE